MRVARRNLQQTPTTLTAAAVQPAWRPGRARDRTALTAAGRRLDLTAITGRTLTKPEAWQADAWRYRDALGEIRYAMSYLAYAVSRCRTFPAIVTTDDDDPIPLDEATIDASLKAAVEDIIDRVTMGTGLWTHIVPEVAHCMEIAGEAVIVGRPDDALGEVWDARSVDSVRREQRGWTIIDTPGAKTGTPLPDGTTFVARVWQPHPRWRGWADSPMRALLDPCEELVLISRTVRGTGRSRIAGAGLLGLPDGLSFPGGSNVMDDLTAVMEASMSDEASAANVVPAVIQGDGELLKQIVHLTFDRPLDKELVNREQAALRRLGAGLDVPPEIVTGMADVNHWTAWQVDSSTIKNHVEPLLIRVLNSITDAVVRPLLLEAGFTPAAASQVVLWYSVDPLTVRPNRGQDADEAFDREAISWESYREAKGFGDDDAPDADELAERLALKRGTVDVDLVRAVVTELMGVRLAPVPPAPVVVQMPQQAPPAQIEAPAPAVPVGGQERPVTPQPTTGVTAAAGAPRARLYRRESARLARIDTDTRERLATAADAALTRALERAGNRARGAAQRDPELRAVAASAAPGAVCSTLGRDAVTASLGLDVTELLAGAWAALAVQWDALTASGITAAARTAARITGQPLPASTLAKLHAGAVEGWAWLERALTDHATSVLFDPEQPDSMANLGEDPGQPGRVTSLTRGALTIAGGVPGTHGGVRPDGTVPADGAPTGGLATGDTLMAQLRGEGVEVVAYEWVYGVSRNVFEPHAQLDGVIFSGFSSPVLANPDGWPGPVLAPGDHPGCHCDASVILGDGTATSALLDQAGDDTYDPEYLDVLRAVAATDRRAGLETTVTDTVAEADRIAAHRPSRRS